MSGCVFIFYINKSVLAILGVTGVTGVTSVTSVASVASVASMPGCYRPLRGESLAICGTFGIEVTGTCTRDQRLGHIGLGSGCHLGERPTSGSNLEPEAHLGGRRAIHS